MLPCVSGGFWHRAESWSTGSWSEEHSLCVCFICVLASRTGGASLCHVCVYMCVADYTGYHEARSAACVPFAAGVREVYWTAVEGQVCFLFSCTSHCRCCTHMSIPYRNCRREIEQLSHSLCSRKQHIFTVSIWWSVCMCPYVRIHETICVC